MLNAKRPPLRSTRATSGTTRCGSAKVIAPWSQKTRSKLPSGNGSDSALPCTSGKSAPAARACSSCRSELSKPTQRAPCAASRIDHCAAPQPSSSTSFPATSPSTCSSLSGSCQIPQRGSGRPMCSRCVSWYSSARWSQKARFRSASDELIVREPERDLAGGGLGGVGAVDEIVRHREREVAADRPGPRLRGIGGAHRLADGRDRSLALDHEREGRARGDERDQLAEERLLDVLRVVALGEGLVDPQQLCRRAARAPRRSRRATISPARPRSTASGFASTSVLSTAMAAESLFGAALRAPWGA